MLETELRVVPHRGSQVDIELIAKNVDEADASVLLSLLVDRRDELLFVVALRYFAGGLKPDNGFG